MASQATLTASVGLVCCCMKQTTRSKYRLNNSGESGQPYRMPIVVSNVGGRRAGCGAYRLNRAMDRQAGGSRIHSNGTCMIGADSISDI